VKAEQRDELLVRIDERVEHIKETDVPEIKNHLLRLNGAVYANSMFRKLMIRVGLPILVAVGGLVIRSLVE